MLWLLRASLLSACAQSRVTPATQSAATSPPPGIACAPEARGKMSLQALRPGEPAPGAIATRCWI